MIWLIALAAFLALVGASLALPGVVLLGIVSVLVVMTMELWHRHGLDGVTYERDLGSGRAVWGDEVDLRLTAWNAKLLPLPRLTTDDLVDGGGLEVVEQPLTRSDVVGVSILRSRWSLLWYERVTRFLHVRAIRRGVFSMGPVRLEAADLFGRDVAHGEVELPGTFTVLPRSVPVISQLPSRAPLGARRATQSLFHDPALFAGVRPYQPGDAARQRHWRASARTSRPLTKRFEPSHERQVVLVLDVQTAPGPHWLAGADEELLEALAVTAASLARSVVAGGDACGFAAGIRAGAPRSVTYIPPRAGAQQAVRIAALVARIGLHIAAPYEQVLAAVAVRVAPGTSLVTISSRPPTDYLATQRRLVASGFVVHHVAIGPSAAAAAATLRAARIPAVVGHLEPDWRRADAFVTVG
ncbi:MAG: DUF58 domain-containing protein [Candidatus Limnocylindrales bacterium]